MGSEMCIRDSDGTAARPIMPPESFTSTSTVGLPRESRIWRATISSINVDIINLSFTISTLSVQFCHEIFKFSSGMGDEVGSEM